MALSTNWGNAVRAGFKISNQKVTNHIANMEINSLFLMRHGWAEHNELGILASAFPERRAINLLPKGETQVLLGFDEGQKSLLPTDRPITIVCSPSTRALQSGAVILKNNPKSISRFEVREELKEKDCGKLEGFPYRAYLKYLTSNLESGENHKREIGRLTKLIHRSRLLEIPSRLCKIEPCSSVENRVTSLMRELQLRSERTGEVFLLLTHEFTGAVALNALINRPPGMFWTNRHIPNGKVLKLDREYASYHFNVPLVSSINLSQHSFGKQAA